MKRAVFVLLAAACGRDFTLAPQAQVTISSFSPAHAYAGGNVTITGTQLGTSPSDTEVRFGTSLPTAPVSVAADGTSITAPVPDDASDGAITVTAPKGRASSAASFKFDGLGHLRLGVITASADLRPTFTSVVGEGPGAVGLVSLSAGWSGFIDTTLGGILGDNEAGTLDALAFAPDLGSGTTVTVDHGTQGCPNALFRLVLPLVAPICLTGVAGGPAVHLAVDPAGTHAAVAGQEILWLVDIAAATVKPIVTAGGQAASVGWDAGTHFLVVDDDGLHRLDWTQDPPLGAAVASPSSLGPDAFAVLPGKKAAICAGGDSVYVLDVSGAWPPPAAVATRSFAAAASGAAFSADGSRLLVSSAAAGKAVLFDLGPPALPPIASVPIEGAGEPAAVDNTFLVPGRGAVYTLAQSSGALLDRLVVSAGLRSPQVRTIVEGSQTLETLEIASHTLNTLTRLKADTFAPALLDAVSLDGPEVDELASSPHGYLVLRHGLEVRKLVSGPQAIDIEDAGRWSPPDATTHGDPQLSAAPDGSAALLLYTTTSGGAIEWKLALLDPTKAWSASYQPAIFPLSSDVSFRGVVRADGQGRLALVGDKQVQIVQLAQALQGTLSPLAQAPLAGSPITADFALGSVFVLENSVTIAPMLQVLPALAQEPPPFDPFDDLDTTQFHVAPGGRRVWMLRGQDTTRRLVTVDFDPDTGAALGEEAPIALPPGASLLQPFDDGTRLLVVDTVEDRVLLIE